MASPPIDLAGMNRLDGRTAIVTGASSGFGDRFARVLAEAGCVVYAAARRTDRLEALAAEVPSVVPVTCDVTIDDELRALRDRAVDETGRIDVLVNNAGRSDAPDRAQSEEPARFRDVVEVNLNAVFVLSGLCGAAMIEAGSGSIINIASVHGFVASAPNTQAGYVATKGAVITLTKELACQWATSGIRVNALCPGYFETELTAEMIASESGEGWITRNTPLKRIGRVDELDGPLLFLASDASSYVTGSALMVDGGWTAR